jgi:hypothetical protein
MGASLPLWTPKTQTVGCPPKRGNFTKRTAARILRRIECDAAKQVAPAKKSQPPKPPAKVYILFGADEYAKSRAARFPELLTKAAASMSLRLVEVTEPDATQHPKM